MMRNCFDQVGKANWTLGIYGCADLSTRAHAQGICTRETFYPAARQA